MEDQINDKYSIRDPDNVNFRNSKNVASAAACAGGQDSESFFRGRLGDVDEPTAPFGLLGMRGDHSRVESARELVESGLSQRLREQAHRLGASSATMFYAAWALVMAHTSGRDDVIFGCTLPEQAQGNTATLPSPPIPVSTLPLRLRLQAVTTRELIERTHRELADLLQHKSTSLDLAHRCSGLDSSTPLVSTLLKYRHGASDLVATRVGTRRTQLSTHGNITCPITIAVNDLGERFALEAQTDQRIEARRVTRYLYTAVQSLVTALEEAPQRLALTLPILDESERDQVINQFNGTHSAYPQWKLLHQLFEEQVKRTPDAVAAVHRNSSLTYGELDAKSNQMAQYLRDRGVGADDLVGICVERSLEMVVGLLGILKAGGAYVALDPNYPDERMDYMLKDTGLRLVLTQERLRERVSQRVNSISLDSRWSEISQYPTVMPPRLAPTIQGRNLAYVIYTSGSTGKPKGVAIEHRNAVNLVYWARSALSKDVFRQTLQSTSLNFDLSVYECFVPLTTGGSIRIMENALAISNEAAEVTLVNTVPSAIRGILDSGNIPRSIRVINLAGEALNKELVDSIFSRCSVDRVCNLYGPTETTTYSSWIPMPRQGGFVTSIGRPIANTQFYILDRNQQPVPIGVIGEIYIGGAGVARGYLHRPELTAQRFLANPFESGSQGRMYRTGDLGRWQSDGTIEFLGRNDEQVKIRGYRIELGEIETRLLQHPQVTDTVVIARGDNQEKRLVAYVVTSALRTAQGDLIRRLREFLKERLPQYMIPATIVALDKLPLTANGKIDRRKLPVQEERPNLSQAYVEADSLTEKTLCRIWREALRLNQIGVDDDFFELGGHSLIGTKLITTVAECFAVPLTAVAVFQYPTIRRMSQHIDGLLSNTSERQRHARLELEVGTI
jgi:amino acid adenylation domain-containing protein